MTNSDERHDYLMERFEGQRFTRLAGENRLIRDVGPAGITAGGRRRRRESAQP